MKLRQWPSPQFVGPNYLQPLHAHTSPGIPPEQRDSLVSLNTEESNWGNANLGDETQGKATARRPYSSASSMGGREGGQRGWERREMGKSWRLPEGR
jgi:hypothetical protein